MELNIWKFILRPEIELSLPKGYEILSAGVQGDDICLWVKLNPQAEKEPCRISTYGTGHPIKDTPMDFIDTVQMNDGLVFHVFKRH